jgi:hypothetical protein
MRIDTTVSYTSLGPALEKVFGLAAAKAYALDRTWEPNRGAPVFTVAGKYASRGWTEWTHGFQYGIPLLIFEATGQPEFLVLGRRRTLERMPIHLTHTGVHDHGFNIVSTYGALYRLIASGRIPHQAWEKTTYETALKCSGAVQASRWSTTRDGHGFVYSFNGPHSLFCDTIRSMRSLALAHSLGQTLRTENDVEVSLFDRLIRHVTTTAKFNVYYGEGRDCYDRPGRVAHESIFNPKDGNYRCPSTQQGYSPFSTWTRGHAWILCGAAELLNWLDQTLLSKGEPEEDQPSNTQKSELDSFRELLLRMAKVTADFYLSGLTALDGIPYWDDGAPGLSQMPDWRERPADPSNRYEPVDSSAAAIAAQGLLRLGLLLNKQAYIQAALTVAQTLMKEPYLSTDENHQGLLLHTVYHRPNGWDYIPKDSQIPCGESCLWGDYHLLELALLILRLSQNEPPYRFFV